MGNQFIPKEICVLNADTSLGRSHHVFREPFPLVELSPEQQKTVQWLTNHYHGLSWSGVGYSSLSDLQEIMDEVTYGAEKILVKGDLKAGFLKKYVGGCQIIDLASDVPALRHLNLKASCTAHNFPSSHCAMSNVYYLYNYLKFNVPLCK